MFNGFNFLFISFVDGLPCLSLNKERVQLSLVCRFLKGKFSKVSEILFDLIPISSEEYECRFNSSRETSDKALPPSLHISFYLGK